jgi:hypothetical protein
MRGPRAWRGQARCLKVLETASRAINGGPFATVLQSKAKVSDRLSPNTVNRHSYGNPKKVVFRINVWDNHVELVKARPNQPAESPLRTLAADGDLHRLYQRQRRTQQLTVRDCRTRGSEARSV